LAGSVRTGGNAELPPGTVFDVTTVNDLTLAPQAVAAARQWSICATPAAPSPPNFMLDDFVAQPKHDTFRIKVSKAGALPTTLVIDSVDGKPIDALPLTVTNPATTPDGLATAVAEIDTKSLSKYFVRGINRFEVAYTEDGQRKATESSWTCRCKQQARLCSS